MATELMTKQEMLSRTSRTGVILLANGQLPLDYPSDKALIYMNLKNELAFKHSTDLEKLQALAEEIKHWPRNEQNDPYYYKLLELVNELRFTVNFVIDVAFKDFCFPDLKSSILNMVSMKVLNILIVPLDFLSDPTDLVMKVLNEIKLDDFVNIQLLWPYDLSLQVDFITEHLLRYMRKHQMFSY